MPSSHARRVVRGLLVGLAALSQGLTALPAQTPSTPTATAPKPAVDPATRARERAAKDLHAIAQDLSQRAHAYTGTCRSVLGADDGSAATHTYSGGHADGIDLLVVGELAALHCGDRMLQRTGAQPWTKPQGDMPECPAAPNTLLSALAHAQVKAVAPAAHDDKPAMRASLQWTDRSAASLLAHLSSLDPRAAKIHERLPQMVERGVKATIVVDAAIVYDPARRQLFAATVRVAMLGGTEADPDAVPPTDAAKLPVLDRQPILATTYELVLHAPDKVPFPELTPAERTLLLGPRDPAKTPSTTPSTGR